MTWLVKHKVYLAVAAIAAYFLFRKGKDGKPAIQPVWDVITSGKKWGTFDVNPDSTTYGEPVFGTYGNEWGTL